MKKLFYLVAMLYFQTSSSWAAVYETLPSDFAPVVEVAACYCKFENTILLLQYGADKKYSGKWGIPGGKLEKDEDPLDGVIREVKEETGIAMPKDLVVPMQTLYVRDPEGTDFVYHMYLFSVCEKPQVTISPEHLRYEWVGIRAALEYPLIPDERECIEIAFQKELHGRDL